MERNRLFILFGKDESEYSWRGLWLLMGVYFGSILISAIISPWIYHAIINWANNNPSDLGEYLKGKDFDNYFDRIRWIPVLIGLPWLMKHCGLMSWNRLGVHLKYGGFVYLWRWAVVGMITLALAAILQAIFLTIEPNKALQEGKILEVLIMSIPGAILLGLLEEIVFRGMVFRIFYTALKPTAAVLIGSLFFAYTHFKMPSEVWDAWEQTHNNVEWHTGFWVGFWTIFGFLKNFEAIPFLTYFVLGVTLCLLFIRTRSLMPAIGLHAGLVYIMFIYKDLFRVPTAERGFVWGSTRIVDGVVPLLILSGICVLLWLSVLRRNRRDGAQKPLA